MLCPVKFYVGGLYTFQYPTGGDGELRSRVVLIVERHPTYIKGFDVTRLGYRSFTISKIRSYVVKINDPKAGPKWEEIVPPAPIINQVLPPQPITP